jgi:hypothetical protein
MVFSIYIYSPVFLNLERFSVNLSGLFFKGMYPSPQIFFFFQQSEKHTNKPYQIFRPRVTLSLLAAFFLFIYL